MTTLLPFALYGYPSPPWWVLVIGTVIVALIAAFAPPDDQG